MHKVLTFIALLMTLSSQSQVKILIHQTNYTGDTLIHLERSSVKLEEVLNSAHFEASVLAAKISNKRIGSRKYSNNEILEILKSGNGEGAEETPIIALNIQRADRNEFQKAGHSENTKALARPGSNVIRYEYEVLANEMDLNLTEETAGTLLHEYMHILGFLHDPSSSASAQRSDVPNTFGDLARRALIWEMAMQDGIVGKWQWIYSIESHAVNHEIIPASSDLIMTFSSDGYRTFELENEQLSRDLFFPIEQDRTGRSFVELPFEVKRWMKLKSESTNKTGGFINLGNRKLTMSQLPENHTLFKPKAGMTYLHVFERME